MKFKVNHSSQNIKGALQITGSKSESNRLLIIESLFKNLEITNLSNSDDSQVMKKALTSNEVEVDIHHAGTAMRFLTAYFAVKEGRETVLTGSKRMQERPIKLLVEALRSMGAEITYEKNEGYPPIRIQGKKLQANSVSLQANISSQYISALMLIGASLPHGLTISLEGQVTSTPYILMTLEMLQRSGIQGSFEDNTITIEACSALSPKTIPVESDWSSASYFYSIAALCEEAEISLSNYRKESLQGDSCLAKIYKQFGVTTSFGENSIMLKKSKCSKPASISEDLRNSPDIAQTIAVTCLGLGVGCKLTGLHTLKIKETDRLVALKNEIEKLGGEVVISNDHLELLPATSLKENIEIATYNDHRMAMAFAPIALKTPVIIEDAMVVSKSYPDFYKDLESLNFTVQNA
ncbi:3-phosphoshikimate 1-carboxyvinyltransferase [Zunongwangia endophytica]|uniref:3-phosphoshikimate 1-carboxyvinyltransferase n=1 Tax=Zunongwangia endophytica TaxID=1808945 RepID=A0ABV8H5J6_9FLAO|nr:3-phosphoshikimate 1-carboxyvinyltransferase [Zunongwangia endophytica]MDN3595188.1 3-phosphoshikimate 1-carboxyvinyltransferase [Zunongwangia endophytica]